MVKEARIALLLVIAGALVNKWFLHWFEVTPAALIASALVALTLGAGQKPGGLLKLLLVWWTWFCVCLLDLFALHLIKASGMQVLIAAMFCAGLVEAAHRRRVEEREYQAQFPPLKAAPGNGAAIEPEREAA